MATRRRDPERQLKAASDLRADFRRANLLSLWMRWRLRAKGISPGFAYFAVTLLALMMITLTGHLGGILSGVETP